MSLVVLALNLVALLPAKYIGIGNLEKVHSDWYYMGKQLTPHKNPYKIELELTYQDARPVFRVKKIVSVADETGTIKKESEILSEMVSRQDMTLGSFAGGNTFGEFFAKAIDGVSDKPGGWRSTMFISGRLLEDRTALDNVSFNFAGWTKGGRWADLRFVAKSLVFQPVDNAEVKANEAFQIIEREYKNLSQVTLTFKDGTTRTIDFDEQH